MRKMTIIVSAIALVSSGAAMAHQHKAGGSESQKCELMKDGKKMEGMMQKGADGKMSCQMMDHSKMDHSKMDHSKMDQGKAKPE
ncbi:hypothetical protein [Parasphingorhabdus sp.]|uniref:hypothetical protein n=1 Tax=Parasphingorhabdus sp. TaxID=2709688 RepID=UPI002F94ED3F